jgi:hypothetical protein
VVTKECLTYAGYSILIVVANKGVYLSHVANILNFFFFCFFFVFYVQSDLISSHYIYLLQLIVLYSLYDLMHFLTASKLKCSFFFPMYLLAL